MALHGPDTEQTILRDPALFFWILIPITIVMILTGLLRHYATVLMNSPPAPPSTPLESRERQILIQASNFRSNASSVLSPSAQAAKKQYFINGFKEGSFLKDPESRGQGPPNPMSDPQGMDQMMGMMKGNMMMMIPQSVIMGWINAAFAGFVICNESANAMAQQQMAQMNPAAGANPFGPGQDPDKMFLAEAENMEVMEHFCILDGIEERLLQRVRVK
ncbi:ER membrane complex subunit 3 [Ascosphaera pollenicola]|nr:ER membrane complex subunit 3 [Ascosphaera pollenicola]